MSRPPAKKRARPMKVAIGSDHGGFKLKGFIAALLAESGYTVFDLGAHDSQKPSDYPDIARLVGEAVLSGKAQRGILVCSSGVGACVAANKLPGIRASICHDTFTARQAVEHDDLNVLCLGEKVVGTELSREIVLKFLEARFSGGQRYRERLRKLEAMEKKLMGKP